MEDLDDEYNPLRSNNGNNGGDSDPDNDRFYSITDENRNVACTLFFITCIIPIVLVSCLPLWKYYKKQRRVRDEVQRRVLSAKLAETIRETYLLGKLKHYSTVLSKSDIRDEFECDDDEVEEEGNDATETTTTTTKEPCVGTEAGSTGGKQRKCDNNSNNGRDEDGDNEIVPGGNEHEHDDDDESDDIEMQRPKNKNDDDENRDPRHHQQRRITKRTVYLPPPGQPLKAFETPAVASAVLHASDKKLGRSDGCAVCLNPFEANQTLSWSSNPECRHVFHHRCLLEWFEAVGTKAFLVAETHRREDDDEAIETRTTILAKRICGFPTQCPCCRRDYFLDGNNSGKAKTKPTETERDPASHRDAGTIQQPCAGCNPDDHTNGSSSRNDNRGDGDGGLEDQIRRPSSPVR